MKEGGREETDESKVRTRRRTRSRRGGAGGDVAEGAEGAEAATAEAAAGGDDTAQAAPQTEGMGGTNEGSDKGSN